MDAYIVLIYCLCDDLLKPSHHRDDPQCRISDGEVMTIALVAACFLGGTQTLSNAMLSEQGYIKFHLSRSRFSRRLQRVRKDCELLLGRLGTFFKEQNSEQVYVVESMPVAVCDNYRIPRCRIYQDECYRGEQAGKRRYIYGLKIHLLVTGQGDPVEFTLTAASVHDLTGKRKCIETTNSLIERILPKHIHAVTKEGFETKVALFVIAAAINLLPI